MTLDFFVAGLPKPAGSKRAFIVRPKVGRARVAVTDASGAAGMNWRALVAHEAFAAMVRAGASKLLDGPLVLTATFYLPRPKGHFAKSGALKPRAPRHHAMRPDTTKLVRAAEDALTGVVWRDDAQIVSQLACKSYGSRIGVRINVKEME